MNNLSAYEKRILNLMQKDNFRGLSKSNVMQLASILDKVDPEVAQSIVSQMPEVVKSYVSVFTKGIESINAGTFSCIQTEDDIIKFYQKEIVKDGIAFEERQYFTEKMENAIIRKEQKDIENKEMTLKILKLCTIGVIATVSIFIGRTTIKLHWKIMLSDVFKDTYILKN